MKKLLFLLILIITSSASQAQSLGLKELFSFKDHDITFVHKYLKGKGYSYEKNRYDERDGYYAYVFLDGIADNLHELLYDNTGKNVKVTFGTTDVADYERMKSDMELLQFKFVKYVPKHENGRSVLMMVYSDGYTKVELYNSYIECADKHLVRYYRIRVI